MANQEIPNSAGDEIKDVQLDNWAQGECIRPWVNLSEWNDPEAWSDSEAWVDG